MTSPENPSTPEQPEKLVQLNVKITESQMYRLGMLCTALGMKKNELVSQMIDDGVYSRAPLVKEQINLHIEQLQADLAVFNDLQSPESI